MGSVTVRIIGRRVDFTVRINPLMSTPPLQEGLLSGGRRASTNQMQASCGSGMSRKKSTNERIIPNGHDLAARVCGTYGLDHTTISTRNCGRRLASSTVALLRVRVQYLDLRFVSGVLVDPLRQRRTADNEHRGGLT